MKTANTVQTSAATVALGVAVKEAALKAAKRSLAHGEYHVDTTVRIHGTVKKAEDHTAIVAQAACPWKLLAVALNKLNGVCVDTIVADAENITKDELSSLKEQTKEAIDALKMTTVKTVSGRVTSKLQIEEL